MSWDLVNQNNLDLFCNKLHYNSFQGSKDTNGNIFLNCDFYTGSSALDYTLQKSGQILKYNVFNGMMTMYLNTGTGFTLISNPLGTGWQDIKLGTWNGGNPQKFSIPYKLNSVDNIFNFTIPIKYPNNNTNINVRFRLVSTESTGIWDVLISVSQPTSEFLNGSVMTIDNFCIMVPVIKL